MKKFFLCCFLSLCLFLPVGQVFANEVADINRTGSISVLLKSTTQENVDGVELAFYKVADVVVNDGYHFVYSAKFANNHLDINDNFANSNYPSKLAEFIDKNKIAPDASYTSSQGKIFVPQLEMGLYLFVQSKGSDSYSKVSPFLVTVPFRNQDGSLSYDVEASPKMGLLQRQIVIPGEETSTESKPATPSQPTKPEKDKKLPDTGLLWWPVWILFLLGLIFVFVGFLGRRHAEENEI